MIWIAIKETGSDVSWMNTATEIEGRVFKDTEAAAEAECCHLVKVSNDTITSNGTVSSSEEKGHVVVEKRPCTGENVTKLVLCMKCKVAFSEFSDSFFHSFIRLF